MVWIQPPWPISSYHSCVTEHGTSWIEKSRIWHLHIIKQIQRPYKNSYLRLRRANALLAKDPALCAWKRIWEDIFTVDFCEPLCDTLVYHCVMFSTACLNTEVGMEQNWYKWLAHWHFSFVWERKGRHNYFLSPTLISLHRAIGSFASRKFAAFSYKV